MNNLDVIYKLNDLSINTETISSDFLLHFLIKNPLTHLLFTFEMIKIVTEEDFEISKLYPS